MANRASHITWSSGNAVKKAALDAREQILSLINRVYHYPIDELYLEDEAVKCQTDPAYLLPLKNFVVDGIMTRDGTFKGGPINARGMFMPEFSSTNGDPETSQGGHPNVHYTVGAAALNLEIDRETGKMRVLKAALAIDAGKA